MSPRKQALACPGDEPAQISDAEVQRACALIDQLPSLEELQTLVTRTVGRKRDLSVRALFVGLLLSAVHDGSTAITRVSVMLHQRISPEGRALLGVPARPDTRYGAKAGYRAVLRLFHAVVDVMDPSAMARTRDLVPRDQPRPKRTLTAVQRAENAERLLRVCNELLEQTFRMLPADVQAQWRGDLGVDATPVPAFSRGRNGGSRYWPADPDAAWYVREGDHRDRDASPEAKGKKPRKYLFAYEATLAVLADHRPSAYAAFPRLVLGMTLHKPGHAPGPNALHVLRSICARNHPAGLIGADRNYNNSDPESFQLPARALGYRFLFDYREDQLGIQASADGAIQVEGSWYCPSMPAPLIEATKLYRAGTIDEDTYAVRINARAAYLLRPKSAPDAEGHQRWQCPAEGPRGATVDCDCKPHPNRKTALPLPRVLPVIGPTGLPKICSQHSITIPPSAGAKHAQDLRYGTPEARTGYGNTRNAVEGKNGYVKLGDAEGLADPSRRRVRGIAAQSLLVGFLLSAGNLREARNWYAAAEVQDGKLQAPKRRRKTRPLSDYDEPPKHTDE